jgi:amino acid permease
METIVTVAKAIIGSGIISLPYTVSVMGWVLSIVIFLLVAMANQYSVYLLLKAKNLSKHSTYNSIAYHIYRSKLFQFFLSFINLLANIGFCTFLLIKVLPCYPFLKAPSIKFSWIMWTRISRRSFMSRKPLLPLLYPYF